MGAQVSRFYARPGVTYLPLSDAAPLHWAPTWLVTSTAPEIHAFNRLAQDVAVRLSPAVRS
ncbi:hypothetical protein [Streptomyces sp. NPDC001743]